MEVAACLVLALPHLSILPCNEETGRHKRPPCHFLAPGGEKGRHEHDLLRQELSSSRQVVCFAGWRHEASPWDCCAPWNEKCAELVAQTFLHRATGVLKRSFNTSQSGNNKWLWVKHGYLKWNHGKRNQGLKPAVPCGSIFHPQPNDRCPVQHGRRLNISKHIKRSDHAQSRFLVSPEEQQRRHH